MRAGLVILLGIGGGLAAFPAGAADYRFFGFFTSQPADVGPSDAQLSCAFSFFRQNRDGSYIDYVLDEPAYKASGAVRFLEAGRGQCTITHGRLETCTVSASPDASDVGTSYYDVLGTMRVDHIETMFFDNAGTATAWAVDPLGPPGDKYHFTRCAGFDETRLGAFLSTDMTTLTLDERGPLESPEFDDANRATMRDILQKVGAAP